MVALFMALARLMAHSRGKPSKVAAFCLAGAAILRLAGSASGAVLVDGNVQGYAEGYATGFSVTFDVESGPTDVPGGQLWLTDAATAIYVGFIAPLTIDDNTYHTNKALDWGSIDHFLMGGGNGLEGSDGWKDLRIPIPGENEVKLEFDYIKHQGSDVFSAVVKKAEQKKNSNFGKTDVTFATSLHYNYHTLGLTQFFSGDKNNPVASPPPAPGPAGSPVYAFDPPAQAWIPQIMYEFKLDKSDLKGTFDAATFIAAFNASVFHMSPNKMGGHKVYPTTGGVIPGGSGGTIPEPSSVVVWLLLGVSCGGVGWRRRRKVE